MATRLTPDSWAVRVVEETPERERGALADLVANFQYNNAAYEAWEAVGRANDAATTRARAAAGAGFDEFAILRGWPYR